MSISDKLTRRTFVNGSLCTLAAAAAGCQTTGTANLSPDEFKLAYGPRPEERFPIPGLERTDLHPKFRRQRVKYKTKEPVGSVVVDTKTYYLYHVEADGQAMRYGVGLGRQGFEWTGRGHIAWKRPWPTWTPPAEMIAREPRLAPYSAENGGKPPGLRNPLGARALYIFQGNVDTLYRVHGSPNARSIGRATSSGCVRMVNQDVIHLYDRVKPGSKILVV